MSRKMVYFSLCFFLLLPRLVVMSDILSPAPAVFPAYTPTDNILINCGAPNKDASLDGREWDTESTSILTYSPYMFNTSQATFRALQQSDSVDEIPYSTVRIFSSKFTYTIPVSKAGQKFLRLYFYPSYYVLGFDMTKPLFSVDAANHTLLSNFTAFLHLKPPSLTLIKEYVITVNQSRVLEVTFTPSPNSYAFVNGIEIVSIPDDFYIKGNDDAIKMVGQKNQFYIDDSMALEKLYRFNVGGSHISSTHDTGMFRSWETDDPYLFELDTGSTESSYSQINYTLTTPPYAAPNNVYSSVRTGVHDAPNLTWSFQVDSGFYILRLHFCELHIYLDGQPVFSIFINNQIAEQSVNVSYWSGAVQTPVYKDYVVFVSDNPNDSKSKPYLWLALRSKYTKIAFLNGLEIFKLSQPGGTLAAPNGPNPELVSLETKKNRGISHSTLVGVSIGGSLGALLLFILMVGFILFRQKRKKSQDVNNKFISTTMNISLLPPVRSQKFSVEEIKLATSKFDDKFVIGKGGFGDVYKGYIRNGRYPVAIKRLNPSSRQGAHEFQTEIRILSNLRHRHLVPLIGCCDDSGEMILVYDYMVGGTLRGHLYGGSYPPLSWKQRLQICIGAARGLHYLHAGAECVIIHRDVKSTNILLDEKMVAKVSDFGLSKMGPSDTSVTHMSTVVKGSFGYLDPEYYLRRQLTTKSDVYSFGVVLFEVLCARPVIMQDLPHEQMNLAEWSRICYRKGSLGDIVDANLRDQIAEESLKKFGEVGYSCLGDRGIDRPTMRDVVSSLEVALQLQESQGKLEQDNLYLTKSVAEARSGEASTSSTSSDGFKSGIGSVFSDILNPNAR